MRFVSIIIGSKSDYEVMKECGKTLEKFGVPYELIISSAHRSPERTRSYIKPVMAGKTHMYYTENVWSWVGFRFLDLEAPCR